MALFGRKKESTPKTSDVTETSVAKTVSSKKQQSSAGSTVSKSNYSRNVESVLLRPRITEKATFSSEKGAYVFEIAVNATKNDVRTAIKHFYNVTPVKVNIVQIPRKKRMTKSRGVVGMTSAGKKAYVYVKSGDTIDIT